MPETIQTVSITSEARTRFLRYAMSVVTGRALPDVRDGLKPVQRRILFTMYNDSNLTFDRKAAKCAQIVGDVMGRYHPHGDGAIYEALVRLSQDWVMRLPLVHGEGNFGSVDGDPPAAYRYTEAKLTKAAESLLAELDQETVDLRDNYAGNRREPVVLPAQYPNLLVNGTAGIAVGLATNIPPHNLGEVLRACVHLIDTPDATVAQLLERVKGPDFPLGGKILSDRSTLRTIYETGKGGIKVQAEWKTEDLGRGKQQIVVTSIPYGVDKGQLESVIGDIIETKKLPQLTGLSNETNDKEGMRIVLDVKPGTDPNLVMAYLFKHTDMQRNVSYNVTALVPAEDGKTLIPRDGLSLKEILQHFLDFRLATVRRRFEYHLRVLKRRIHILEGFAKIFNALDKAIRIIRNSTGKADAGEKLKKEFDLDDEQATAILDSQLYKIAQMEIQKILEELKEKQAEAARIETLLKSTKKLWGVVRDELEKLGESPFVVRRRTRMASDEDVLTFSEEAYIVRENTNVVLTRDGWVKRVGRLQSVESTRVRDGDEVVAVVPGSTLDNVIFFADDGTAYTMRINEVPASTGYGDPVSKFFKLADGVKVIAAATTDPRFTPADREAKGKDPGGPHLLVATSNGYTSRLPLTAYRPESTKAGRRYAKPDDAGKVVLVTVLTGQEEGVMLASRKGWVIHFAVDEVNVLAGVGKGVMGIKLDDGDECVGGAAVGGGRFDKLTAEAESGVVKEFGIGAYSQQQRGGKGREHKRTPLARVVPPAIELVNWEEVEGKLPKPSKNGTYFETPPRPRTMSVVSPAKASKYTTDQITALEGLEPVRVRPAMYIGGVDSKGLHHLVWEIVDNCVDEYLNGYADHITVVLHKGGDSVTVVDNGRGIPVDTHPKFKISGLELVLTKLHAGGKFDNKDTNYFYSGGLHGVGASVVNALSKKLVATVKKDGQEYQQTFAKGIPQTKLEKNGAARGTGTSVFFQPDDSIFKTTKFDGETIRHRLEDMSYIHAGLKITFKNEVTGETLDLSHPDGIPQFLAKLVTDGGKAAVTDAVFHAKRDTDDRMEVAMQWTESTDETIRSYVNGIRTPNGGTHENGLKAAVRKAVNNYIDTHEEAKRGAKGLKITAEDIREGVVAIVSVFVQNPEFEGQTKQRLNNSELDAKVDQFVRTALEAWLNNNRSAADAIVGRIILAAKAREASRAAVEVTRKSAGNSRRLSLPGKLADCKSRELGDSELFIVEGDSAGGSAKQGRNNNYQAVLPLRGKILNGEDLPTLKVLQNQELADLTNALGTGAGDKFRYEGLRYGKVILLMDADADGHHICTLLLDFFFRHMPELIRKGHVFIAQPPLYRIDVGKETFWAKDDEHKEQILAGLKANAKPDITRFKGLGEMPFRVLSQTTLDPRSRTLLKVEVDSNLEANDAFRELLGKEADSRYRFIMEKADQAVLEELDV